jgi:hypothetical protein
LLGELHVSLLKSIINDIEDVARTPSVALGVNPGCGHPQIVEGVGVYVLINVFFCQSFHCSFEPACFVLLFIYLWTFIFLSDRHMLGDLIYVAGSAT